MDINRLVCELRFDDGSTLVIGDSVNRKRNVSLEVRSVLGKRSDVVLSSAHIILQGRDLPALDSVRPAKFLFRQDILPEKMTAYYLFCNWWTRPAFISSFREIPSRTQVLLLRYENTTACIVPMVGRALKACLSSGEEDAICFELTDAEAGLREIEEPLFLYAEAENAYAAVQAVFQEIEDYYAILPRTERRMPEMFHYLGWCSWDAFYHEVSADGVRAKAEELSRKHLPVRWMLIDDGWLDTREKVLRSFAPDGKKFPGGFAPLLADIRSDEGIRWVGVWHAMAGYWEGVDPEGELAPLEGEGLCRTAQGLYPDPVNAERFYRQWYTVLREMGIRFVKVDGQSSSHEWYRGSFSAPEASAGVNAALDSAVSGMDGALINCMGMAMENMIARPVSAISRNSDDFFPGREGGFAEHLLQNAYNAVYHNELYVCDWDMFWTSHPDAVRHAMIRAVSGGPVYISDRVGETDGSVLKKIACLDGWIPMPLRSAKPAEVCMFRDVLKEGVLLLTNAGRAEGGSVFGYLAAFNLTDHREGFSFSASDIPEMKTVKRFWVYDYFAHRAEIYAWPDLFEGCLESGGYSWYSVFPEEGRAVCLGLLEKYAGPSAVESIICDGMTDVFVLHESGPTGFLCEHGISSVTVNGRDASGMLAGDGNFFSLALPEAPGRCVITVTHSVDNE